MKKILFIITCILISGMTMQSCKQSDENLKKEVDKEIVGRYNGTINTSVKNGVVTLTGIVESEQEKTSIQRDVEAIVHVRSVINNISVDDSNIITEEPVINSDDSIKSTIESKLKIEGFKDIKVDVNNGDVVLSGDLKRSDLTKVMKIVNELSPGKVTNNVKLK